MQIQVRVQNPQFTVQSQSLAARLKLPLQNLDTNQNNELVLWLQYTENGLELSANDSDLGNPLRIDFLEGAVAHRLKFGGGKGQDIAKAVGVQKKRGITVLDATAGLGRDAFVLASLGCTVNMLERNPIVFELLQDGLNRAKIDPEVSKITNRMTLLNADSFKTKVEPVDVVYLDPMFPSREKTAKVKKELRYLHHVVGYDLEADQLLAWADQYATKRIVVKRPKLAPYLLNKQPTLSFTGKSGRFDVYVKAGLS